MIARMVTKPSSTNSQRRFVALAMNFRMAEPLGGTYSITGWGARLPTLICVAVLLKPGAKLASGHLSVREQPEDNSERDQTDETVPAHVFHPAHDVRCYGAEERQVRADQQREHDRQCQQHQR